MSADDGMARKTPSCLTAYERARVLGARATQISGGAPILVYVDPKDTKLMMDSLAIAKLELEQGKLPMIVRRRLPDDTCEEWTVQELQAGVEDNTQE